MSSNPKRQILFPVRRSKRYHQKRRRFFGQVHKLATIATLVFSSASVTAILTKAGGMWALTPAAVVAFLSIVNLVARSPEKALVHQDLERQFIDLEKEIVMTDAPDDAQVRAWKGRRLSIEAEEPPVKHVLNAVAHNELLRAEDGDEAYSTDITWYQRFLAPFFDVRAHTLKPKGTADQTNNPPSSPTDD